MSIIEVKNLSKQFVINHEQHSTLKQSLLASFKSDKELLSILDDISFSVDSGEFLGIVGRNGCGKSTLLKILANIYSPTSGSVKIAGRLSPFLELGVGFQSELTAWENIFLYGSMLGLSEKQLQTKVDEIIAFSELEKFLDTKIKNFSSGMTVRLAFSVAIQADFDILLLDEVLAVGDANFQEKCFSKFRQFKEKQKTIIFVSHAQGLVEEYCDRALLLEKGKIIDAGEPGKVFTTYNQLINQTNAIKTPIDSQKKQATANRWGNGQITIKEMIFDQADKIYSPLAKITGQIVLTINDPAIKDRLSEIDLSVGLYNHKDILIQLDQSILKNTNSSEIIIPFSIQLPDLPTGYYRFSLNLSHYQKQQNGTVYDHWDKDNPIFIQSGLPKQANLLNTYSFFNNKIKIIGLLLMRNEQLILSDTLDHLGNIVDGIIVYDDASEDDSVQIARRHPKVLEVIQNKVWKHSRPEAETRHRQILLEHARRYDPKWIFYADADERFEGNIRELLLSDQSEKIDGIKIQLFDAYITPTDQKGYIEGSLYNFRKYFGPERRDILMIWRNTPAAKFAGLIQREPQLGEDKNIVAQFFCQHYGKSISIDQWEETCRFYATHFPEPYQSKWKNRQGKAIHQVSDFGQKLYPWGRELFSNSIPMSEIEKQLSKQ